MSDRGKPYFWNGPTEEGRWWTAAGCFDVGRDLVSLVLTANNLPRLDFIAVTHPDRDHLKGLLFIAANYAMKAAYTAPLEGIDTPQHDSPRPLSEAFTAILASRGIPRHTLGAGNVLPPCGRAGA